MKMPLRRLFAAFLCLSLTLPAGASPELSRRTLRAGLEGTVESELSAGLEETGPIRILYKNLEASFEEVLAFSRRHKVRSYTLYRDKNEQDPIVSRFGHPNNPPPPWDATDLLEHDLLDVLGGWARDTRYYIQITEEPKLVGKIWAEVVPRESDAGLEERTAKKVRASYVQGNPVRLAEKLLRALRTEGPRIKKLNIENGAALVLNPEQLSRLLGGHPVSAHIRNNMKRTRGFQRTLIGQTLEISNGAFWDRFPDGIPIQTRIRLKALASQLARQHKFYSIEVGLSRGFSGRWTKNRVIKALRTAKRKGLSFQQSEVARGAQAATPVGRELKGAHAAIVRTGINQEQWHKSWAAALESQRIPVPVNARTGQPLRRASRAENIRMYADPPLNKQGLPRPSARPFKQGKIARLDKIWSGPAVKKARHVVLTGLSLVTHEGKALFQLTTDELNSLHHTSLSAADIDGKSIPVAVWINAQGSVHTVQKAVRMDTGEQINPPKDFRLIYLDPSLLKNGLVDTASATLYTALGQIAPELFDHPAVRKAKTVYAVGVEAFRAEGKNSWTFRINNDPHTIRPIRKTGKRSEPLQVQMDPATGDALEALRLSSGHKVYPRGDATRLRVFPDPVFDEQTGALTEDSESLPETFDPVQMQTLWKDSRLAKRRWVVISGVPMYKASTGDWAFHFMDKQYITGWKPSRREPNPPLLNIGIRMDDPRKRPQWARRMQKPRGVRQAEEPLYPHAGQKQVFLDTTLHDGIVPPDAILFQAQSDFRTEFFEQPAVAAASRVLIANQRTRSKNGSVFLWDPLRGKRRSTRLRPLGSLPYFVTLVLERKRERGKVGPLRLTAAHEMSTGFKAFPLKKRSYGYTPVEVLAALDHLADESRTADQQVAPLLDILTTGHFDRLAWNHERVADFLLELNEASEDPVPLARLSRLLVEAKQSDTSPDRVLEWGLSNLRYSVSAGLEEPPSEPVEEQIRETLSRLKFGDRASQRALLAIGRWPAVPEPIRGSLNAKEFSAWLEKIRTAYRTWQRMLRIAGEVPTDLYAVPEIQAMLVDLVDAAEQAQRNYASLQDTSNTLDLAEEIESLSAGAGLILSGLNHHFRAETSAAPAAGLEERRVKSVNLLWQVAPAVPGSVGDAVLVFREPETFDLAALAVRYGWSVAVPADSPEADALKELLDALPGPKGRYAVGLLESSRFLEGYPSQILIEDRLEGFRVLGLRWDDLPPPVVGALESVLVYLDRVRQA